MAKGESIQPGGASGRRVAAWPGPIIITAALVFLASHTWRKWPDLLVDFGRELYVPWRLAEGQVLYRDIAFLSGPLSQYVNSLWFRLLGVSFKSLILADLAVLASMTWLTYEFLRRASDRLAAAAACLVFLFMFAFAQYGPTGNYNFMSPYSHEATHGAALAVAMIYVLMRYFERGRAGQAALAGVIFGMILLTKAEVALAASAALALFAALLLFSRRRERAALLTHFPWFIAGAAMVPLLMLAYFAARMPFGRALSGAAGAWAPFCKAGFMNVPFYKKMMGMDDLAGNLMRMLRVCLAAAAVLALMAGLDRAAGRVRQRLGLIAPLAGLALFAGLVSFDPSAAWKSFPRCLPLASLVAAAAFSARFVAHVTEREAARRYAALAVWSAFSFALLMKIILNPHIYHYGFFLALPATLLLVACMLWFFPRLLGRAGGGAVFRALALAVVAACVLFHARISDRFFEQKNFPVGGGGDVMIVEGPRLSARNAMVKHALDRIAELTPPGSTMVVVPEGVMLNYLARRINPTPYLVFMVPEMETFGQDAILDSFRRSRPDFVVIVEKSTAEYGVGYFGAGPRYGKKIMDWINADYEKIELIGNEPLQDGRFGIKILKRRPDGGG